VELLRLESIGAGSFVLWLIAERLGRIATESLWSRLEIWVEAGAHDGGGLGGAVDQQETAAVLRRG
jgi:hypothetical protein